MAALLRARRAPPGAHEGWTWGRAGVARKRAIRCKSKRLRRSTQVAPQTETRPSARSRLAPTIKLTGGERKESRVAAARALPPASADQHNARFVPGEGRAIGARKFPRRGVM